ncbi:MAG: glycosyltransferase family 4 protein, partial [Anaerolineae bacterium]|nr:glycosyltransferase family 4 protein [Anaerolineae bacterium]
IDAFAQCIQQDLNLDLIILGDGQHRTELEERARNLGVENRVHFLGLLPGTGSVREKLDEADLFVLPSRSEGLPRAMVEAMARGLPVIGTPVGGVPELLDEESMVEPDNVAALAEKIRQFVTNPRLMREKSERNLEIAHEFEEKGLLQKRVEFLQHVKTATQEWLRQHAGAK